jgi:hypothetical protein
LQDCFNAVISSLAPPPASSRPRRLNPSRSCQPSRAGLVDRVGDQSDSSDAWEPPSEPRPPTPPVTDTRKAQKRHGHGQGGSAVPKKQRPDCKYQRAIRKRRQLQSHDSLAARREKACLDLCIALLDHRIQGRLTESAVVFFLGILGINSERTGFLEAAHYTSYLLALVKMA